MKYIFVKIFIFEKSFPETTNSGIKIYNYTYIILKTSKYQTMVTKRRTNAILKTYEDNGL